MLPIPLRYHIKNYIDNNRPIINYHMYQCVLCKEWYAVPPTTGIVYHYYCASEKCQKQIDDELLEYESYNAALTQIFKQSGKEFTHVPINCDPIRNDTTNNS